MNLERMVLSLFILVFSIFLLSPLESAIQTVPVDEALRSILIVIPYLFVVISAVFPLYYLGSD